MLRATLALVCFSLTLVFHLFVAGAPAAASAGPGAATYVNPIVSGTNCSAAGSFGAAPGAFVTQVILKVGGTVVKTYTYGVDDWNQNDAVMLGVTWASTHFGDGASVQVYVWGKDSAGNEAEDTKTTLVYNKAYVLGYDNPDWEWVRETVRRVRVRVAELLHSVSPGTLDEAMSHSKAAIVQNLPAFTVFYIDTHGVQGSFLDCVGQGWIWSAEVLTGENVKHEGEPPYNFVFVDACETAKDDTLARAFQVVDRSSGAAIPDRAFMGWKTRIRDSEHNCNWRNRFWQALVDQYTVLEAILVANSQGAPEWPLGVYGRAELGVYRDGRTKLAGVYGGERGHWYR